MPGQRKKWTVENMIEVMIIFREEKFVAEPSNLSNLAHEFQRLTKFLYVEESEVTAA